VVQRSTGGTELRLRFVLGAGASEPLSRGR
jgi:hypothetical protein